MSLLQQYLPSRWFSENISKAQTVLIISWSLAAFVLSLSYRSILLSTLIPIRYEHAIETMADGDATGLPIYMIKGSSPMALLKIDQRSHHKNMAKKIREFSRTAEFPEDVLKE